MGACPGLPELGLGARDSPSHTHTAFCDLPSWVFTSVSAQILCSQGCLEVSSLSLAECGPQGCCVGLSLETPESLLCMGSPEVMSGCFKYPFFDDLADRNSVTTSYAMRFAVQSLLLLRRRKT